MVVHHIMLHGSTDVYMTGVNTLLRQQTQAATTASQGAFLPVTYWLERGEYFYDSWIDEDVDTTLGLQVL